MNRAPSQSGSAAVRQPSRARRTRAVLAKGKHWRMCNHHGKNATAPRSKTLLWIDDYAPGLAVYKAVFESFGYRVLTECDGRRGLNLLQRHCADAVVVDYEMPGMDGEAVAAEVRRKSPKLPIVMFSGCSSIPARVKQMITAFCEKTGSLDHLRSAIDQAVRATA